MTSIFRSIVHSSIRKSIQLGSAVQQVLSNTWVFLTSTADFTFTRAGDQFGIDGAGQLVKSTADNAAFISGEGILLEGARTNLLTNSQTFDSVNWPKQAGATATANQAIAPDGTMTADLLDISAANSFINMPITFTAVPHVYPIWLRSVSGTGTYPLNWFDGAHHRQNVNLTTTWQRFDIRFTPLAAAGFIYAGDSRLASTLKTCYAWQSQLEAATFPSSDIATLGATGTRAATSMQRAWPFPANGISELIINRPQFDATDDKGSDLHIINLSDGTENNYLRATFDQTNDQIHLKKRVSAGIEVVVSTPAAALNYVKGQRLAVGFVADSNGLDLWVDDLAKATIATGDAPTDWATKLTTIEFGASFQTVESSRVWNQAQPDSFMESVT